MIEDHPETQFEKYYPHEHKKIILLKAKGDRVIDTKPEDALAHYNEALGMCKAYIPAIECEYKYIRAKKNYDELRNLHANLLSQYPQPVFSEAEKLIQTDPKGTCILRLESYEQAYRDLLKAVEQAQMQAKNEPTPEAKERQRRLADKIAWEQRAHQLEKRDIRWLGKRQALAIRWNQAEKKAETGDYRGALKEWNEAREKYGEE